MIRQPIEKPTWRTGMKKRFHAIPLQQRYEMGFLTVLLLLQLSLAFFGVIAASQ